MTSTSYRDEDLPEILTLLRDAYRVDRVAHDWLLNRMENWRFGGNARPALRDPDLFARLARLWRDADGRLVAVAVREAEGAAVCLHAPPWARDLDAELVAAVEDGVMGEPRELTTFADDASRAALLRERGWEVAEDEERFRRYDLTAARPERPLPDGFQIVSMAQTRDVAGRARAIVETFDRPALTGDFYEHVMRSPSYDPVWDLVVVDEQGDIAAFCLALVDPVLGIAEIDPVGTVPRFQRRGLAASMLTECFAMLARAGIREAFIGSDVPPAPSNRLYEGLVPAETRSVVRWTRG